MTSTQIAPTAPELRFDVDGGVGILTFNAPDRLNAILRRNGRAGRRAADRGSEP